LIIVGNPSSLDLPGHSISAHAISFR
jgi:hypothetical protein